MMDKEILLDSLKSDYAEEITEIIYNCHIDSNVYLDVVALNASLNSLMLVSLRNSLSEADWYELVYELAPDIYDDISYGKSIAA